MFNKITASAIITVHAERLYDDNVWPKFNKLMTLLSARKISATLFTYPPLHSRHTSHLSFDSNALDRFNNRLIVLQDMGHDIQLHSHFYKPGLKENDFSEENINRVLSSEIGYLNKLGVIPIGFVAGGWNLPENVINILPKHGIKYDCSCLTESPKSFTPIQPKFNDGVGKFKSGLIELPTTNSVKSFLLNKTKDKYRMFYFHDYDLLKTRLYLLMSVYFRFTNKKKFKTSTDYLKREGVLLD